MKILVTGGAGFIGSEVVRQLMAETDHQVINVDALTYAGNLESLANIQNHERYDFEKVDICQKEELSQLFLKHKPNKVLHLAAESHVDRSIDGPAEFINTNILGTYNLLEVSKVYFDDLPPDGKREFRFHHVSTDEVFGSLPSEGLFTEDTPYKPNSPHSASKAASDHLVRAWHHTYGLPVVASNCSNNYGPYQFPEKLIPLIILNALEGKKLPIYGKGDNIRDWLFVEDHARALLLVLFQGKVGETYNIGGCNERTNMEVVEFICQYLDSKKPRQDKTSYRNLIEFVKDRPGHDQRYAIDASKIAKTLNFEPREDFASGIRKTVDWYVENQFGWCKNVQDGSYRRERLGLSGGNS